MKPQGFGVLGGMMMSCQYGDVGNMQRAIVDSQGNAYTHFAKRNSPIALDYLIARRTPKRCRMA